MISNQFPLSLYLLRLVSSTSREMPPKGTGIRQREVQPGASEALKFTQFQVIGFLNGKNVASNFVKNDSQSWWHPNRRTTDDLEWDKEREGKRRKLMGSDEVLLEEEERLAKLESEVESEVKSTEVNKNDDDEAGVEGEEGVQPRASVSKKLMINVLTSAPEGKVHKPLPPTVSLFITTLAKLLSRNAN